MFRKNIIKIVIPLLFIIVIGTISLAITNGININKETFSFINKEEMLTSNFDKKYEITSNKNNTNYELTERIKELTKKTTYLLLGEANSKKESGENYYKRHQDYLELRYNPEIPKDENSFLGLDENSQEYKDDILSGISVPGMFLKLNELEIKYNSYGKINVSKVDEEKVISAITLPNVKMKEQDSNNPMNYNIIQTDLTLYYYFKKLNNEYKLLYLYGETNDDIEQYMESNDEKTGTLSKNSDYKSELRDIYNFEKADSITDETLNKVYEDNKDKIVFLNATYNIGTVTSANGFFISDGIIATTYNYIEKSLIKAQNIIISDSSGNVYEVEGIVTVNIENDIAILKVKTNEPKKIQYEDTNKPQKEDAVISINTKTGVGLTSSKGIITSTDKNIQTSLPVTEELQGSPLFNLDGKLIGMINSKILNSSISFATNIDILKEYYNKFSEINYDDVKAIPFNVLKENYYIKYTDENISNNIPQNKLDEFANVENAKEMIELNLIKSSYKDQIISLRFKNDIPNFIDTMQFSSSYRENLKSKGYQEKVISDSKYIYDNGKYQIIVMKEFDYLIVVMVKL